MKKNILLGILFLFLAAAYFAYQMYNKSHKNLNEITADYILKPEIFLNEFEADETKAQTKYLNKVIQLEAQLLEIQKVGAQTIWILATGNPMSNIQCEMDERYIDNVKDKVNTGSTVTIQGICAGKLMDIVLNQAVCIL